MWTGALLAEISSLHLTLMQLHFDPILCTLIVYTYIRMSDPMQSNSNKSKKCYRYSRPLIGRPCLSCGRPNHSHSVQCWKCGSSIASSLKGSKETPTSSDTLGRE